MVLVAALYIISFLSSKDNAEVDVVSKAYKSLVAKSLIFCTLTVDPVSVLVNPIFIYYIYSIEYNKQILNINVFLARWFLPNCLIAVWVVCYP